MFQPIGWEGFKWPFLVIFIFLNVLLYAGTWITKLLSQWNIMNKIGEIAYNEDIDNYWKTLDEHDRNWALSEERNVR